MTGENKSARKSAARKPTTTRTTTTMKTTMAAAMTTATARRLNSLTPASNGYGQQYGLDCDRASRWKWKFLFSPELHKSQNRHRIAFAHLPWCMKAHGLQCPPCASQPRKDSSMTLKTNDSVQQPRQLPRQHLQPDLRRNVRLRITATARLF